MGTNGERVDHEEEPGMGWEESFVKTVQGHGMMVGKTVGMWKDIHLFYKHLLTTYKG